MSFHKAFLFIGAVLILNGCGTMPASGPYSKDIKKFKHVIKQKYEPKVPFKYEVQDIDSTVLSRLFEDKEVFYDNITWPQNTDAQDIKVNVGDTIQVSIFESESGGLFIPVDSSVRPGNFVTLPSQTIEAEGTVKVPYAGELKVVGKTTQEIAEEIEQRIENQAIEPQVVVSFTGRSGAEVSVLGSVNQSQRLELGFNNFKILDVIAQAGGPSAPGYETWVQLQRDDKEYSIPFDQLVLSPKQNIYSEVGDMLYLYSQPEIFNAFGAVQNSGAVPFGKRNLPLSEALGLANGLVDGSADPAEIYIYRQPTKKMVQVAEKIEKNKESLLDSIRVLNSVYDVKPKTLSNNSAPMNIASNEVATIYRLNMREAQGLFLAQKFMMQDQDIVYVANAESVEFVKFLGILNSNATTTTNTKNAY